MYVANKSRDRARFRDYGTEKRRKEKRGEKGGKREGEKKRKGRGRKGFVVSYGFYHKLSSE